MYSECTLFYERPFASLSAAFLRARRAISICEMRLILLFCGRRRTHTHTRALPLAASGSLRPSVRPSVFNTLISARLRRRLLLDPSFSLSLFPRRTVRVADLSTHTPHIRLFFHASAYICSPPALERDAEKESRPKPQTLLLRPSSWILRMCAFILLQMWPDAGFICCLLRTSGEKKITRNGFKEVKDFWVSF